jgi:hypothetical protein
VVAAVPSQPLFVVQGSKDASAAANSEVGPSEEDLHTFATPRGFFYTHPLGPAYAFFNWIIPAGHHLGLSPKPNTTSQAFTTFPFQHVSLIEGFPPYDRPPKYNPNWVVIKPEITVDSSNSSVLSETLGFRIWTRAPHGNHSVESGDAKLLGLPSLDFNCSVAIASQSDKAVFNGTYAIQSAYDELSFQALNLTAVWGVAQRISCGVKALF